MSRQEDLILAGVPFVRATVVRCSPPTSARAGDRALVLGDGTIEGFVGGSCADTTVRLQALRVLETGEPVLLRILPGEEDGPSDEPGAVVVANPCLSGGALELFLEPVLPLPRVAVAGDAPVARAVVDLATRVGFRPRLASLAEPGDFGAVVASLGHGDEAAVRAALEAGCSYVGLVASRRRGEAVLSALREEGVPDALLARVTTPAGLDVNAFTHEEIALSVVAELVSVRRAPAVPCAGGAVLVTAPREAIDPVCGMTVVVGPDTPVAGDEAFCCEGCRDRWRAEHAVA